MQIYCYHEIYNDAPVQGFKFYKSCSEIEQVISYNVYSVIEDMNIDYVYIYAHGSRVFSEPKNYSDIDFVLFYKGDIREDSLFNIFANETIFLEDVRCDFNPIKITNESDIERYIQKHDIEYYFTKKEKI